MTKRDELDKFYKKHPLAKQFEDSIVDLLIECPHLTPMMAYQITLRKEMGYEYIKHSVAY